jgi:hypothetical protein
MPPIKLTVSQWQKIRAELQTQYPRTVFMLRSKMKLVLGFTVREHTEWIPKLDGGYSDYQIHLDFYSENKRTMFLLKFSETIGKQDGEL